MTEKDFETLIETTKDSLNQQKCVLVLGPDIYMKEIDNQMWERKEYFLKLEKELNLESSACKFFPNDEVFYSSDMATVRNLQQGVKKFYLDGGDIQLLESISTIKFPLILNASPDESLKTYLKDIDKNVQFNYFEGEEDEKKELVFDLNRPLIYNVLGKATDPQSLIVTHNILYKKLQQILPINSFPPAIREFLRKASSFLFLGFKFDSWAYQLLSFKIVYQESSIDETKIRLSSSGYEKDETVNIVMSKAVGMSFADLPPIQLINSLNKFIKGDNLSYLQRDVGKQDKFTSFISYSRTSKDFIKTLVTAFSKKVNAMNTIEKSATELKLLYDKEDLYYGQSIDSFMTRIGRGKTVVLVVNNYYLQSDYCMIEALRTSVYHNTDERVFIVLITDELEINFKNIEDSIVYYQNLWEAKIAELTSKGKKPDKEKVVNFLDIRDFIPKFIKQLSVTNNYLVNMQDISEQELDKFITQLIDKMKEE